MGIGRPGRIIEKDRANARVLTVFIPPSAANITLGAASTTGFVRNAAGDYSYNRSAPGGGGATDNIVVPIALPAPSSSYDAAKGEVQRGPRLTSITTVMRIGTANLTSITPLLQTTVYTDGADIATPVDRPVTTTPYAAGSISFHATQMQVVPLTVTTPFIIDNTMNCSLDLVLVVPATSTWQFHGAFATFSLLL